MNITRSLLLLLPIYNNMMVYVPTIFLGDYRVEERSIPELSEGDVLVKILAVGICAGDAKCFAGAPYFWGMKTCKVHVTTNHNSINHFQVVRPILSMCSPQSYQDMNSSAKLSSLHQVLYYAIYRQ